MKRVESDPSIKLGTALFPDAKTQMVSNFFKVLTPRINFSKNQSSLLIFSHAFRRYKAYK